MGPWLTQVLLLLNAKRKARSVRTIRNQIGKDGKEKSRKGEKVLEVTGAESDKSIDQDKRNLKRSKTEHIFGLLETQMGKKEAVLHCKKKRDAFWRVRGFKKGETVYAIVKAKKTGQEFRRTKKKSRSSRRRGGKKGGGTRKSLR